MQIETKNVLENDGRSFKSIKEVYNERKVRVACLMSMPTSEWKVVSRRNELHK